MLTLEIYKNEVERARLVKEAKFPVFLCTAEFNFTNPRLLKLCWGRTGPKQNSMDNPNQYQGMVYFNASAVYWMRIESI